MNISKATGSFAAKVVKGLTSAPKATGGKIKQISSNIKEGYREVIPAE